MNTPARTPAEIAASSAAADERRLDLYCHRFGDHADSIVVTCGFCRSEARALGIALPALEEVL